MPAGGSDQEEVRYLLSIRTRASFMLSYSTTDAMLSYSTTDAMLCCLIALQMLR